VVVTVREQVGDRQHDLGPFRTTVTLKSDVVAELGLTIGGMVKGDVTILAGEKDTEKDRISLGAFPRSTGVTKMVTVEAGPTMNVVLDSYPSFMKAELTEDKVGTPGQRKTWSLTITVPGNAVMGPFGLTEEDPLLGDTSIYLKANGRKVRVPVAGAAVQR
jgi:hypothetical protein